MTSSGMMTSAPAGGIEVPESLARNPAASMIVMAMRPCRIMGTRTSSGLRKRPGPSGNASTTMHTTSQIGTNQ